MYCDSQPLPLFHRPTFMQTIDRRDPELLFAMLALTARFSGDVALRDYREDDLVEASRAEAMQKVYEGTVELSTLQSLCLLSLVDFTSTLDTILICISVSANITQMVTLGVRACTAAWQ